LYFLNSFVYECVITHTHTHQTQKHYNCFLLIAPHDFKKIYSHSFQKMVYEIIILYHWFEISPSLLQKCKKKLFQTSPLKMYNYASSFTISSSISLFYQRAFHFSLTVLVFYRSPILYLVLEEFYLPYSYCTIKQYYSKIVEKFRFNQTNFKLDYHHLWFLVKK